MAQIRDVTQHVDFDTGKIDGELMPLLKCVCGATFPPYTVNLSIYEDDPTECPKCGREFYFTMDVRILQVLSEAKNDLLPD